MQEHETTSVPNLFTPVEVGPLALRNRVVMAPLTRSRAGPGNVPTQLNALYYAQRASAGLIISEATQISPEGQGYISTPGIHSAEQIAGWKCVTQAVHVAGGQIVLPALARRTHLSSFIPAGRGSTGRALGHQAQRTGVHGKGLRADPNAARARNGRDSRHRRAIRSSGAKRPSGRVRRGGGARRQRLFDRPVSPRSAPTSARTATAAASTIAVGS